MTNNRDLTDREWGNSIWRDAGFWQAAWQKERADSLFARQQPERSDWKWWDQRAAGFANMSGNDSWQRRQEGIFRLFERLGYLYPEQEVLDIGCGPGNYALTLARRVKRVVALDPSPKMLAILEQRAQAAGLGNIETVCQGWEEIELQERGWQQRFGLVLAAMTPGISDVHTLKKMVDASHQGCFFNGLAWCTDSLQQQVWRRLFSSDPPPVPADVFYVFHLLQAWGYAPSLELKRVRTAREMSEERAAGDMLVEMSAYLELTPAVSGEIRGAISAIADQGSVAQQRDFLEGVITWSSER